MNLLGMCDDKKMDRDRAVGATGLALTTVGCVLTGLAWMLRNADQSWFYGRDEQSQANIDNVCDILTDAKKRNEEEG